MGPNTHSNEWSLADDDLDRAMGPATAHEIENGAQDVQLDDPDHPPEMASTKALEETHATRTESRQIKPNKVYIGGLPDHTRPEDLRNCFGKIGTIVAIELKLGFGFVEFENKEAAQESVARYHEGYFMGNKIRVELSHSRGRTFKRLEDPGACYSCGESGHWARDCPRSTNSRTDSSRNRDYSSRDHHQSRDTHGYRNEYSKHSNSREDDYYDAPVAAPTSTRDHRRAPTPPRDNRRALTPPRDRRDNPPQRRENDDYRVRGSPPLQPVSRHERSGHHGSERDYVASGAPTHRNSYDRYDRRHAHSDDRSAQYTGHTRRPRTPPGLPPQGRDEHDKAPRGHYQTQETHRRAVTPPPPYPSSNANGSRARRRSISPPPRYESRHGGPSNADNDRYSTAPREGTRVRDYHRSGRGEDASHRRS